MIIRVIFIGVFLLFYGAMEPLQAQYKIVYGANASQVNIAIQTLKKALESRNIAYNQESEIGGISRGSGIVILHQPEQYSNLFDNYDVKFNPELLQKEGFQILRKTRNNQVKYFIIGGDPNGAMYGTMEIAEKIGDGRNIKDLPEKQVNPRFSFRAIKFNLPWSSYRDGKALNLHTETCRDLEFWEAFLDMMAENRFNVLSLWNLHPYPYMFRPENYPDATPFTDEELAEWRSFWQQLFQMAKDRGIETYLVNWNIFVSPAFADKYNVAQYKEDYNGEGDTSQIVKKYNRQCVTQLINEYPNLTGIGTSVGERMGGMTPETREAWIKDVYFEGLKQANRPVKFIHRAPFSIDPQVTRSAVETTEFPQEPVWMEMKFNWSHGHSTPGLSITHGGEAGDDYWEPLPENYKMAWTVRNEDFFILRWGEPGFIREHINKNGKNYAGGYFIGSETYIPARDYFQEEGTYTNWQYAFERQWLFYKEWGRLLYNPDISNEVFVNEFARRYGENAARPLFQGYQLASRMPLRLASFYKASWDYTLYSEGFLASAESFGFFDGRSPFISVDELIEHETLDPDFMAIPDYVRSIENQEDIPDEKVTPIALADSLEKDANQALSLVNEIDMKQGRNPDILRFEINDIKAWSYLSLYFAKKLRGGVALELFRYNGRTEDQNRAVSLLVEAANYWEQVIKVAKLNNYRPVPLMDLDNELFHWRKWREQVERDIIIARDAVY